MEVVKHNNVKLDCGVKLEMVFYVSKENKTVVARPGNGLETLVYVKLRKIFKGNITYFNFNTGIDRRIRLANEYYAKAVCQDEDVFDVEKGISIAEEKLKKKLNVAVVKRVQFVLYILKNCMVKELY